MHALIGFWDFPVSTMVPSCANGWGCAGPATEAVVKCEHKYWSRLEQAKVIDEFPGFGLLDLDDPVLPDGLDYPVWLKPIRSASSELAFRADDPRQLADAAAAIGRASGASAMRSARCSTCWTCPPSWPASEAAPAWSRRRPRADR